MPIQTGSYINTTIPELLLFSGVLSGRKDGIENILGICISQVLRVEFRFLRRVIRTFTCFLPELETRTGLEYLTKLWGWLKLEGPVDICNFCKFK